MSADNWTKCPRCAIKLKEKRESSRKKVEKSYGRVSAEDYMKKVEGYKSSLEQEIPVTLREDYWLGIRDGIFKVSYGASCHVCGFEFNHEYEQEVK